ncbi:MAG: DNA translocase FtsK, partial [Rhizobiaceae bacterium]|nr:DNA translocase FtsK [Rhizobiaceae bacterium]
MGRSNSAALGGRADRFSLSGVIWRQVRGLGGFALLFLLALAVAALATWNVMDPSYSYATANAPTNILGFPGAAFADMLMQSLGLGSVIALLPVVAWAIALISNRKLHRVPARLGAWVGGSIVAASSIACFPAPPTWPIPNGIGGVIGDIVLRFPALFIGTYPSGAVATVLGSLLAIPAIWLMLFASGLVGRALPEDEEDDEDYEETQSRARNVGDDDDDDDRGGFMAFGAIMHAWYNAQARARRLFGMGPRKRRDHAFDAPYDFNDDEFGKLNEPVRAKAPVVRGERVEPSMDGPASRRVVSPPSISIDDDEDEDEDGALSYEREPPRPAGILPDDEEDEWALRAPSPKVPGGHRVVPAAARPKPGMRAEREAQTSFIRSYGFQLPAVHLLAEPRTIVRDATLSSEALEQNARMLEGVLEDFGVKGEIIHVRPGPVVTLYELEPAPGIKSSRVIGLADDIARSMSAIAARVAVVPGRNAIGIELPNSTRETVYLRELIASRDFETSKAKLAMALGKTIGGEPVIADLAKMPHLLVAGTTGSGKSVAINTMILSLLYRMTPEQCRLIMIDPKMLELSVYDGIPHLLSPVVTDPKKAVVALKWTVREMEERYKKMSKIGVRNIDGFNTRVEQAVAKGEAISRTVQTGFDRQTGEAIYETEEFDLKAMPYIVVIIDEMADLMMVAGKDIEGAVQRLAQMARAAGIHVIMATQRPSVDVITGTIKANFPTRISFQVTSKIDSRTILGEQGAEQLLGMGDMLYMAGGGRIQRVHGPFVADGEVEDIVAYLKTQGAPQYLDAFTAD